MRECEARGRFENALAQVLVISSSLALAEQNIQRLVHVNPEELVDVPDRSGEQRQDDSLAQRMRAEMASSEGLYLEIVLDDERSVETL